MAPGFFQTATQEEEHAEGGQPKAKRQKRSIHLPEETEDKIIQFMIDNPALYNMKMTDFRNKGLKDNTWKAFGATIGLTLQEIHLWYTNQRTELGRIKKLYQKTGGAGMSELTERQHWVWSKMHFLKEFIVTKVDKRQLRGVSNTYHYEGNSSEMRLWFCRNFFLVHPFWM